MGFATDVDVVGKSHADKWEGLFQLVQRKLFPDAADSICGRPALYGIRSQREAEAGGGEPNVCAPVFGHDNPIGQRVHIMGLETFPDPVPEAWFEIIGVVADVKNNGLQDPIRPEIWVPYTVTGSGGRGVLVRTSQEPLAMLKMVQQEIWATDSGVALTFTGTLEGYINSFSYAGPRFGFLLMTIFGSVGLVLVTLGLQRPRLHGGAKDARDRDSHGAGSGKARRLRLVVTMGVRLVALGAVIGLVASLLLARVIATQLWGVSPYDP